MNQLYLGHYCPVHHSELVSMEAGIRNAASRRPCNIHGPTGLQSQLIGITLLRLDPEVCAMPTILIDRTGYQCYSQGLPQNCC